MTNYRKSVNISLEHLMFFLFIYPSRSISSPSIDHYPSFSTFNCSTINFRSDTHFTFANCTCNHSKFPSHKKVILNINGPSSSISVVEFNSISLSPVPITIKFSSSNCHCCCYSVLWKDQNLRVIDSSVWMAKKVQEIYFCRTVFCSLIKPK
jgi:hypothetical protein